jgi:hypothetical protein
MKNKTWKKQNSVRLCGYCEECNKELLSNEGGWIISYNNKKYYCHDGKDGSCYDNYCERKLKEKKNGTVNQRVSRESYQRAY